MKIWTKNFFVLCGCATIIGFCGGMFMHGGPTTVLQEELLEAAALSGPSGSADNEINIIYIKEIDAVVERWVHYQVSHGYVEPKEGFFSIITEMYKDYGVFLKHHGLRCQELPFLWMMAQMFVESSGDADAVGSKGELGLWQCLPTVNKINNLAASGLLLSAVDLKNPNTSFKVAMHTMCHLILSQGSLEKATRYYNVGVVKGNSGTGYLNRVRKEYQLLSAKNGDE